MSHSLSRRRLSKRSVVGMLSLLMLVFLALPGTAQAAATTFSGQAKVVSGEVAGVPIKLVDTGPVDAGGGDLEQNLLCYPTGTNCTIGGLPDLTNGMLNARVLHAAVTARGSKSHAEASTAEFDLVNVAGNNIGAEFLQAEAEATCTGGQASVEGTAEVADLVVNNQHIEVTGEVNQRVPLLNGGFVVINEQVASVEGGKGDITVSALHIVIPGLVPGTDTDVVIAQAHADINCGATPGACPGDKITGGAWDETTPVVASGEKLSPRRVHMTLGAAHLSSWGHFLYMDKVAGIKFHGQPSTATLTPTGDRNGKALVIGTVKNGETTINGVRAGFFEVLAEDNGEPGRGTDQFTVALFKDEAAYDGGGTPLYEVATSLAGGIDGGNLQYHGCKK